MICSLTHPDTHPDSPEKHNSHTKFKDEINIHKLSKRGLKDIRFAAGSMASGKRNIVNLKKTLLP